MFKVLCIFVLLSSPWSLSAADIALSIGSVPVAAGQLLAPELISKQIVFALHAHQVPRVGVFANFSNHSSALEQLKSYDQEGHLIANFTADGLDLTRSTAEDFAGSIYRADQFLKQFPGYRRYFRYPRLDKSGGDQLKEQAIASYLQENNYLPGIYTVDSYDWYIDQLIKQKLAEGFEVRWDLLKDIYVRLVLNQVRLAENKLKLVDKSQWPIIVLFQESEVTARYLGDVLRQLKDKHRFISYTDGYLFYQKNIRNLEFDFVQNPVSDFFVQDYQQTTDDYCQILEQAKVFRSKNLLDHVKRKWRNFRQKWLL